MWKPDFSYSGLETVIQFALKEYKSSLDDGARVEYLSIAIQQIEGCLPKLPICQIWTFSAFGIKVLYMSLSSTDYCCFVIKINF